MEKVKIIFLLLIFYGMIQEGKAQEKIMVDKGLLRAQLTLSPSRMLSGEQTNFYLHGNVEGYLSSTLSLAGEGYYYLGSQSVQSIFDYNHSLFFGASWHFVHNSHDIFLGLQPGLSITRLSEANNNLALTHKGANPLFSWVMGYNYYVNEIFHFFIQTRLILGEHNYDLHKNLSELRLSAGLGFNFNAGKK